MAGRRTGPSTPSSPPRGLLVHNVAARGADARERRSSSIRDLAHDGHLYFTVNQLYRQPAMNDGEDLRERPYALMRVRVDAEPVLLT